MCAGEATQEQLQQGAERNLKVTLEIIYSDVCGPIQVDLMGGNKSFVTFIDDFNRKLWTYLIKKKSEVIKVFSQFQSMVERQSGRKLKVLRTDGGGECCTPKFALPFPQHFLITRPLKIKIQLGFPLLKTSPCTVDPNQGLCLHKDILT